jgi:predicted regulator of Ras-like GTPase activity (Roadblock/LC7/MglB family)
LNELREPLESIVSALDGGALAATIMGMDGLPVDGIEIDAGEVDVSALLVEYSSLLGQVQKSAQMFAAGGLEELAIRSEHLTTIIRPINREYLLCLAMRPTANFGKGRYLLRVNAPKLASALS